MRYAHFIYLPFMMDGGTDVSCPFFSKNAGGCAFLKTLEVTKT